MKRTLALILTLALLLTTLLGVVPMTVSAADPIVYNEKEPNNSNSSPDNIAPNYLVKGKTTNSDTDKFCFTIDETATVTYSGEADHLDLYTCLYDLTTGTLKTAFPQANTMRFSGTKLLKPGTYYLQMSVQSAVTAARTINYSFLLTVEKHEHVYDDNCDTQCNDTACNATRTAPHNFADRNDTTCSCGKSCTHEFNYDCDTECKLCHAAFASLGHDFEDATCTKPKTCKNCGVTEGEKLEHNYGEATCTKPKTCAYCGATKGAKADHVFDNACDDTCNVCNAMRVTSHTDKATTTKATLKENGKTVNKCSVCGKTTGTTTIYYAKTVKLSKTQFTYTGKTIKPTLVVKTSKGETIPSKYYTVSGTASTKKIGKFKITLKFKGNYSGSKTLYYTINPKTVASLKLKAGKKQMTVSYKKDSSVGGYEIVYATNKSFKKAKTTKVTSAKKTINKLTSKKTYYVKVRAYKKVSGKTYYGAYCKAKIVKVK